MSAGEHILDMLAKKEGYPTFPWKDILVRVPYLGYPTTNSTDLALRHGSAIAVRFEK